jgi:PAS domain S-box-containing protein
MDYKLEDLINISLLQNLQEKLNLVYSFPSAIIDNEGKVLTAVAWQDICTKFHRIHPECEKECIKSDQYIMDHLHEANPAVSYQCPHGLVDNATPIIIDGKHYGNFFTGQFFLEKPDIEFFRQQSKKYGFDETAYLAAVQKVPVWTKEKLHLYLDFIKGFIEIIVELTLKSLKEKEARTALTETEKKYKTLFNKAPLGYQSLDFDGKFIEVNQQWLDTLGYSFEEVIGKWFGDFLTPVYQEGFRKRFPLFKERGQIHSEFEMIHKNGDILFIAFEGRIGYDDKGDFKQTHCILQDITDKKKTEEKLKDSENRYRTLVEQASDGVFLTDAEGNYFEVNSKGCEMLGYSREEILKLNIKDVTQPEDHPTQTSSFNALKKGNAQLFERTMVCKDGTKIIAEISTKMINENCFLGIVRDITDYKQKEAEVLHLKESLELSLDASNIGTWSHDLTMDPDRTKEVSVRNLRHDQIFGYNEKQALWGIEKMLGHVIADDKPMVKAAFDNLLNTGLLSFECSIQWTDQSIHWISVKGKVSNDDNGNPIKVNGTVIDISDRKQAEIALIESEEKYRLMVENSGLGVGVYGLDGSIQYFNQKALDNLGGKLEDYVGKSLIECFGDVSGAEYIRRFNEAIKTDKTLEFEDYVATPNGGKWFYSNQTIIKDANGNIKGVQVLAKDITERKNTEEKIKESEEKYKELVENSPDAIVIYEQGIVKFANKKSYEILGANENDSIVGKPIIEFVHPDSKALVIERMKKIAIENSTLPFIEEKLLKFDGNAAVVELKAIPIMLEGKKAVQLIIRDLAERKLAEEKIRETELHLQSVFSSMSDLVFVLDKNGVFIDYNNPLDNPELYLPPALFLQKHYSQVLPLEIVAKIDLALQQIKDTFTIQQFEYALEINNSSNWYNAKMSILKNSNGDFAGTTVIVRNITEQKLVEEKIRKTEQYFKSLIEKSTDGIVLLDEKGEFKYVSPTTKRMFGYDENEDITGNPASDTHPDDLEMVLSEINKIFIDPSYVPKLEYRYRTKSGSWKWVETIFSNMLTDTVVESIVLNFRDITERKLAEEKIKESKHELQNIFNNLQDAYFQADINGIFTKVSPSAVRMYRYKSAEEMIGMPAANLYANPKERVEIIGKLKENHKIEDYVSIGIRKDRTTFGASMNVQLIYNEAGQIIGTSGVVRDITERKLAEEKIREKDKEFRKLSANVPDLIYQFTKRPDGSYCVPIASEGIKNIFGCTPEDVIDNFEPIASVIYPEDAVRVINDIEYSAKHLTYFTCEFRVQIPGREIQWIYSKSSPEKLADGSITWYGFNTDITNRKLAEEKLKENEALLRIVFNTTPSAIYIKDHNGFYLMVNNEFAERHNTVPSAMIGLQDISFAKKWLTTSKQIEEFRASERKVIENKETLYIPDEKFVFNDGTIKWYQSTKSQISINDNPNYLMCVSTDITDRKQAEQNLIEASVQIKNSEYRLKLAIASGQLGIWDWNIKENTMVWDARMFELYGITQNDFSNNFDVWTNGLFPDDKERALDECNAALKGEKNFNTIFRVLHPNGTVLYLKADGIVIRDSAGEPIRMIGINKDITESKLSEQELIKAKEKAEESDRLKSAFLANMSHEIRTPMNGILGFSELLKEPGLTGEEQQEYIHIIEKSGARMLNIINNIVDISKIEAGLMEISFSVSNINEQIEYIYTFFKPEVEEKGMKLSYKTTLPFKEAYIQTDHEKLYAILINLVKNAIKYSEKGFIEIGCNLKTNETISEQCPGSLNERSRSNMLEFYVKDTGIGIPKNRHQAIFERFIQADISDKRAYQGAGLGLAITKAYVELLDGNIWLESEEGIGSCFYFTIPYITINKEAIIIENPVKKEDIVCLYKNLNVLIADDDECSRMLISMAINKFCKEIIEVETGVEVIAALKKNPDIDLIIMDVKMPEMDGYEACRLIREFNTNVIIIIQTAFAFATDKEEAKVTGCNDYLSKPFTSAALIELINKNFNK